MPNSFQKADSSIQPSVENLSRAIFTVNKHAKTAPDPSFLYLLKRKAIEKLLLEGKAIKKGLHYSRNPKKSHQQSDVLIQAGDYFFHIPSTKNDFAELPHLGELDEQYRNPKTSMSLSTAKKLLQSYVSISPPSETNNLASNHKRTTYQKPVFKRLGESYR
ncbi:MULTISPECIES: YkyB family protein [Bacillus]|uniref:YkyB family protein n=1 Tax=Bacillus TaxID=1386 RepID=UPI000BB85D16|nr:MULTISPECIES: YkyB family protein [Bacillus]